MDYEILQPKPALVYEVYLPKKMSYASKLAEVLDSFFTLEGILEIPQIIEMRKKHAKDDNPKKRDRFVKKMQEIISGYSIYEVDGRFAIDGSLCDERVWIIRFIIHDPSQGNSISSEFYELAESVIQELITKRFAKELGTEDEIWFLKYKQCTLSRWVKKST